MNKREYFSPDAFETSYDDTTVGDQLDSIGTQAAISASPGFGWGKPGSASPGEFLLNESVESDKVGRLVPFDGYIFRFFFIEQKKSGTRTLEVLKRTTPGTGSFTVIGEVTATGSNAFGNVQFPAPPAVGSIAVSLNEELAVRVKPTSADFENVIVGVIIKN